MKWFKDVVKDDMKGAEERFRWMWIFFVLFTFSYHQRTISTPCNLVHLCTPT